MVDVSYVSITGLELRGFWHAPTFWLHAVASMKQARQAQGCLAADARTIQGVHHTRTVWVSRDAMHAYLRTGAHLKAMKVFDRIATGKVFGAEMVDIPDWNEVHSLWRDQGRVVGRAGRSG